MKAELKRNLINISLVIIFTVIYIFYLNSEVIFNFVWHFNNLFIDLKTPVGWLKCEYFGYNPYTDINEYCKIPFAYGKIFLSIPYNISLDYFYTKILPYLLIVFFIYSVVESFDSKNLVSYILLFLAIFNPATTFIILKMNFDIFIFLFVIFLSLNRVYLINWILIFFLAFTKIYPAILGLIVFLENKERKIKNIILIIASITLISIIYLLLNINSYHYMLNAAGNNKAGFYFLFSLNSIPKILNYLFNLNYIFLLTIFYSLFIGIIFFLFKKRYFYKNLNFIDFYSFKFKIFFLGASISILSFIFFSNWFHREIFIILTIPFLLSFYKKRVLDIFKIIIYLIIFKYLYSYAYAYINVHDGITYSNNQRVFSNYFIYAILLKSVIDVILMIFLSTTMLFFTEKFLSKLKKDHL